MAMIPTKYSLSLFLRPWTHLSTGGIMGALFAALMLTFAWFFWHHAYYSKLGVTIERAEQRLKALQADEKTLAELQKASQQGLQVYQDFHRKHIDRPAGPEYLQEKIKKWQKQLKIETLHTQVGAPILESEEHKLWRVPITVDLSVLKDKVFFQFLDKVQWDIPGVVMVKSFTITRVSALTDDMVRELIRGNGKDIKLFQGKIELDWIYTR
jgi:hypothetical protein